MSDHDAWCTPRKITKRLPLVDLDPCSNSRSTIRARRSVSLETGGNGLLLSWRELSVFVNPPYSDVLPWALKAWEAASFCFLVNVDPSTKWWRTLVEWPTYTFLFRDRIRFKAPPGIESSSNDRAQCLICDPGFRLAIGDSFRGLGDWWKRE